MTDELDGIVCDHVGSFLGQNFQCLDCHKFLTKQEFQLKVSRQIIICEEEIKRQWQIHYCVQSVAMDWLF